MRQKDEAAGLGMANQLDSLETSIQSSKMLKSGSLRKSRESKVEPQSPTSVFDDSKSQIS